MPNGLPALARKGDLAPSQGTPAIDKRGWKPTAVIEVRPEVCHCGQQGFPETTPCQTDRVIELPEIQMAVTRGICRKFRL